MQLFKATTEQFVPTDLSVPPHSPPWITFPSSIFTASPRPAVNLLLLIPNETALPGSGAPGKTGSVADVMAGTNFFATVEVVDAFYNPVSTHTAESLDIVTSDTSGTASATQTFVSGQSQGTFIVQMRTAGAWTATGIDTNLIDPTTTWTPSVSPAAGTFNVLPGAARSSWWWRREKPYAPDRRPAKRERRSLKWPAPPSASRFIRPTPAFNLVPSSVQSPERSHDVE